MKCYKCGLDNKPDARTCRKCGTQLVVKPLWLPDWKWHLKVLGIIYVTLIVLFFLLNALLKPYMRKFPRDITPWLNKTASASSGEQKK